MPAARSDEAERRVLGSMLRWNAAIDDVAMILRADDFAADAHQRIYEAILALHENSKPVDLVTVAEELHQRGRIEDVKYPYLMALWDENPTGAHAEYYARLVRDKAILRGLSLLSARIQSEAESPTGPVSEVLATVERDVFALSELGISGNATHLDEALQEAMERIDQRDAQSGVSGIASGLADLDELTGGFQKSEMVVIGARPSTGKTSLGIGIAMHAAIRNKIPTVFFSLEQSRAELGERILCAESGVDSQRLRQSQHKDAETKALVKAFHGAGGSPLFIDDRGSGQSMTRIAAQCRRLKRKHGIQLAVIDYLQLIEPECRKVSRHEQIGAISRRIKLAAKELAIPVIAMAQLNRDSENSGKPKLSSLRESGDIEQDADVVMLLYRAEEWSHERQVERIGCIVGKNRNGRTGEVELGFRKASMRFENVAHSTPWSGAADGIPN